MIAYRIAMRAAAMISAISLGLAIGFASPAPVFADPVTPEESDADMAMALQIADGYWRNHWSQYFTGTYTPPRVVGLYDSRTTQLACGGAPVPTGNALYCLPEDFVAFDLVFMEDVYGLGDSFIYLVVAHEWGHAIQARLNVDLQHVAKELQADCLAGAVLYGAARDGALQWEAGDTQELANSLNAAADQFPWTRIGDHGNTAERIGSFNAGQAGPAECIPQ